MRFCYVNAEVISFALLFFKLFRDDIKYLLSMENLWKKRTPPEPLDYESDITDNRFGKVLPEYTIYTVYCLINDVI